MGIAASMALLRFGLLCADLLAWPAIALGYPLFASIKAVESDSKYHMKKLAIYWTLFSLFSIFEFAFVKIIELIPFWSSVRLIVVFWLVIPGFDGSNHAYHGLVRPVLLMKMQAVINRFHELREERICKRGTVLGVVEKYIKGNGPEAVEKLIALELENQKWIKSQRETKVLGAEGKNAAETSRQLIEPRAALQDGETVQATEKVAATATQSHQIPNAQSTCSGSRKDGVINVKEMRAPDNMTPPLMETQQHWACELCKVTNMNEMALNAHLQGRRHKSKIESLKGSLLGTKDTRLRSPLETAEKRCREKPPVKKAPQDWTCDICKVTTTSELMLNIHFHGSKHKSNLETLKASELGAKLTLPSHSETSEINLAKVCEKFIEETGSITTKMQIKATEPTSPVATSENRHQETPLKEAQQEWTSKASDLGAEVGSPSHSATSELNLANVSENFFEESGSELENIITSKVQDEAKEMTPPEASVENSPIETPPVKLAQQEWACDLCKVKATNEFILNSHLRGRKHKFKLDSLKASMLGAKDTGPAPLVHLKQSAAEAENIIPTKETAGLRCLETTTHKKAQQEWTCDLCKVTTTSEITLNDHFHGSKHKSKLEALKATNIGAKVTDPSHSATSKLNLANVCEKFIEETGSELEKIITSKMQIKAKELTSPEASAENGHPKTPLKQAQQEWTSKASNLGAKVASPSDSAISKLNLANMSEKFIEESGSGLDNNSTTKVQNEAKETTPPVASVENSRTETPPLKLAQQEWACDLCKVKATNEIILNAHLQGRKHKSKLDSLKASMLDGKDKGTSPLVQLKQSAAEVKNIMPTKETAGQRCQETTPLKKAQQEWTCNLCKVATTSEITLNDHFNGSQHKSKLETLKASKLDEKVTRPSHSETSKLDICNVSDRFIEERGSELEKIITSKVRIEAKETTPPEASAENRHAETPPLKLAQQEWTCDLCKVKVLCEKTLTGHFKGKKHQAKLESLKKARVQIDAKDKTPPEASAENRHAETPPLKIAQQEWTCDLCKVKAPCKKTLNGHFKGRKRKAKLESLKKACELHTKDT